MKKNTHTTPAPDRSKLASEAIGIFCLCFSLLLLISIASYNTHDPSLNHVVRGTGKIFNWAGKFGAYVSAFWVDFFGFAAYVPCLYAATLSSKYLLRKPSWAWWRWAAFILLAACVALAGAAGNIGIGEVRGGGLAGKALLEFSVAYFSKIGSTVIWVPLFMLSVQSIGGFSWLQLAGKLTNGIRESFDEAAERSHIAQDNKAENSEAQHDHNYQQALPHDPNYQQNSQHEPSYQQDAQQDSNYHSNAPRDVIYQPQSPVQIYQPAAQHEQIYPLAHTPTASEQTSDQAYQSGTLGEQFALAWPGALTSKGKTEQKGCKLPFIKISSSNVSLVLPPAEKGLWGRIKHFFKVTTRNKEIGSLEFSGDSTTQWLEDLEQNRIGKIPAHNNPPNFLHATENSKFIEDGSESSAELNFSFSSPQENLQAQMQPRASQAAENLAPQIQLAPAQLQPASTSQMQLTASKAQDAHSSFEQALKETAGSSALNGVIIDELYQAPKIAEPKLRRAPAKLPGLNLLSPVEASNQAVSRQELEAKGRTLMTCLNDFSIQAELVRITPGPVVTSFELRPAPGVKTSRISGLSDDIALGLKAIAVRIQAPIPGTDTVGIEIPNSVREIVGLRELMASNNFRTAQSLLTLAIGKDISGVPAVADLAKMPHMLVAGATGTGKSVFLNSVLMSILYKARPDQVKLLLIDPKRIELAVYADLPHLVHPIVTEMALAKNALDWAVAEMERRYSSIAKLGVRNVGAYNEKLKEMGANRPPDLADLEEMPFLVIIIDELADLMLTAGKEVEVSIVRLAQLARAAGMHLILATQRPSVDVVTGLIKANFPCRISFQVTSKHDSRTILDTVGAEHLLGRGDMLFKPAGGRFQRLHGAFVSDEEVSTVADYWRKQQPPDYRVDFSEWGNEHNKDDTDGKSRRDGFGGSGSANDEEQKYNEAVEFVRQQGKASISLIQRRFRIGFNGAARIIEQMEQDGIIGPADGSKPRVVR